MPRLTDWPVSLWRCVDGVEVEGPWSSFRLELLHRDVGRRFLNTGVFFTSRPWLAMVQLWACEWGGGDKESFSVDSEWFWLFLGCSFIGFFIHFLRFSICGFWIAKFSLISWIFNELFCPIVSQWKGGESTSVETFMCPQASVEKRWKEFDWAVWFCDFNKLNLLQLFLDFHDNPNWFFF